MRHRYHSCSWITYYISGTMPEVRFYSCYPCQRWRLEILQFKSIFSGIIFNGHPIKKWLGVRASKSFRWVDVEANGREFIMASISTRAVDNCSNESRAFESVRYNCPLSDLTAASHNPTKYGVLGGMNWKGQLQMAGNQQHDLLENLPLLGEVIPVCTGCNARAYKQFFWLMI